MNTLTLFLSIFTLTIFTACGGGSSGSDSTDTTTHSNTITTNEPSFSITNEYTSGLVGKFIDSPVSGLSYKCDNQIRKTDTEGLFNCESLPVTFSLGNLILGSIEELQADYLVFPQDILKQPRSAALHPEVTKMAILLQSTDEDGNSFNGISIDNNIIDALQEEITQETNLQSMALSDLQSILQTVIANSSNTKLKLVTVQQAQDHILFSISNNYESPIQP